MSLIKSFRLIVPTAVLLLLSPATLFAHPMQGVGDFYAGMLHPLTGIEWVLPIVALSLHVGQQGRETALYAIVVFPIALAGGAVVGVVSSSASPAPAEIANICLMAALGLLVAWAGKMPLQLSVVAAALLGLTVGFANGTELTPVTSAYRFITGLAVVGLLLISYGFGFVRWLKSPWTKIGIRVVGSWIAAVGILFLGLKN